jgi:hypothetical protein
MTHKYIHFLGMETRRHHLSICIVVGVCLLITGHVLKHELAKAFGDVLCVPAAERLFARLERE